jgi:hypothetical protein
LIGNTGLASGVSLSNWASKIDFSGSGLENNWIIISLSEDEWCALIAEEVSPGKNRGFFTNNRNLVSRCLDTLNNSLPVSERIKV